MSTSKAIQARVESGPPWLWFWMGLYLLSLPSQVEQVSRRLEELFWTASLPGEAVDRSLVLLRVANLVEIIPFLVVFLGVLAVFVPPARAAILNRRYRLEQPPDLPVLSEITSFLHEQAPDLGVAANLRRTGELAFVYPLDFHRFNLALFGGFILLWRKDPAAARSVLQHEIAHYRQGDALTSGVGTFFQAYLRIWLPVFLLLVALPVTAAAIAGAADLIQLRGSGLSPGLFPSAWFGARYLLQAIVPTLIFTVLSILLWTVSILTLPLAGMWCSELSADWYAQRQAGDDSQASYRSLGQLSSGSSRLAGLLSSLTHPPPRLRTWLANQSERDLGLFFLLLIFPLAYALRLLVLLAWGAVIYLSVGYPTVGAARALLGNLTTSVQISAWLWVAMLGLVLLWPSISRYWSNSRLAQPALLGVSGVVLLITMLMFTGLNHLSDQPLPGGEQLVAPVTQPVWLPGMQVEVEWQGQWWQAVIREARGDVYLIHYEGYDNSWDEEVPPVRIRPRSP